MRKFNMIAAVAAALLTTGAAVAKEKPEAPKGKKVCTIVEPAVGRLPAKRVCHVEPAPGAPAADIQHGGGAGNGNGHDPAPNSEAPGSR